MNIVLGHERAQALASKYVVLPLDSFQISGHQDPVTSYCVIEHAPMADLTRMESLITLHEKLMSNYAKKNWNFCEQAIEHLKGRWNGELDTFYDEMSDRINKYKEQDPGPDWSPVIVR